MSLPRLAFVIGLMSTMCVMKTWSLPKDSPPEAAAALPVVRRQPPVDTSVAEDFLRASQHCEQLEALPPDLRTQVHAFRYADRPVVHRYVHCVWSRMDLWNDRDGFQIDRIAELYRTRANAEQLVPILSNCNRNEQAAAPARWCYRATKCILDSAVGQWFRDEVARVKTLPNGH